jgi:hypothetical protein
MNSLRLIGLAKPWSAIQGTSGNSRATPRAGLYR